MISQTVELRNDYGVLKRSDSEGSLSVKRNWKREEKPVKTAYETEYLFYSVQLLKNTHSLVGG